MKRAENACHKVDMLIQCRSTISSAWYNIFQVVHFAHTSIVVTIKEVGRRGFICLPYNNRLHTRHNILRVSQTHTRTHTNIHVLPQL